MKTGAVLLLGGILCLLASCALQRVALAPVALAPVGPGPFAQGATSPSMGDLEVYSATEEYYEDGVPYYPHTDYEILAPDGTLLKHVRNHQDHQDESPARVTLPPGQYVVRALAQSYGFLQVPVVLKPDELTTVMLDPDWKPEAPWVPSAMVTTPDGYFVGWRADWTGTPGIPMEAHR